MVDDRALLLAIRPEVGPLDTERTKNQRQQLHALFHIQVEIERLTAADRKGNVRRTSDVETTRPLRGALVAAAVLAVVAVATAVVLSGNGSDVSTHTVTPAATIFEPSELRATVMPASPVDIERTNDLLRFRNSVVAVAFAECARDSGYAAPTSAPPSSGGTRYFEDPVALRVVGFNVTNSAVYDPDPTDREPDVVPKDVADRCSAEGAAAAAPIEPAVALTLDWLSVEVPNLESSAALRPALGSFLTCLSDHGISVQREDDFFTNADNQIREAFADQGLEGQRAVEMTLANTYADCLEGGLLDARTAVRTDARAAFVDANADAYSEVASNLGTNIDALEAKYGLTYGAS